MEPHVFCGPEFILAVPKSELQNILFSGNNTNSNNTTRTRHAQVQETMLVQWQADIYSICSPRTRRALHEQIIATSKATVVIATNNTNITNIATEKETQSISANPFTHASTSIASGLNLLTRLNTGQVHSAPLQVEFIQVKYDSEMSNEEKASLLHSIKLAEQNTRAVEKESKYPVENKATTLTTTTTTTTSTTTHSSFTINNSNTNNDSSKYREENASLQNSKDTTTATTTNNNSNSNNVISSYSYLLLYLTDSRVAAEVYMLLLRNVYLSLSGHCRLFNYFRLTARAAPIVLSELLHKRERLRNHYNLDADLWSALQEVVTEELRNEIVTNNLSTNKQTNNDKSSSSRLLTSAEEHHAAVKRLLHYCETRVQYAGVFDEDENASPFLCAYYFANEISLTYADLLQFFVRHPRRVIRVLALFLARYLMPPEEWPLIFYGTLFDEVVIACSMDLQITLSVQEIANTLLRQDEFNEAWLPTLHKYWLEHVVLIDLERMSSFYKEQQSQRHIHRNELNNNNNNNNDNNMMELNDKHAEKYHGQSLSSNVTIGELKGTGKGIAGTHGFHSLRELVRHAEQFQEQTLVPQRMVTLVAHQRGIYDDDDDNDDGIKRNFNTTTLSSRDDLNDLEMEDETRDFFDEYLIDIDVIKPESGNKNNASNVLPGLQSAIQSMQNNVVNNSKRSREDASLLQDKLYRTSSTANDSAVKQDNNNYNSNNISVDGGDTTKRNRSNQQIDVFRKGERLILSLLGRTTPIRPHDPVYLEF